MNGTESMDTSILLARLIGPLFVVVSIGFFINREHYTRMTESFLKNAELYYFSGALAFVAGIAIITFHNLWVTDWRLIITVIGWLSLAKGIVRILFPNVGAKYSTKLQDSPTVFRVLAVLLLIFGGWLSYLGFLI